MRTDRIISSIPKDIEEDECPHIKNNVINSACPIPQSDPNNAANSSPTNWLYPSPKMFWEAMNRKGTLPPHLSNPESPKTQEELEWIVTIHNVVNEQCWQEICKWERFRVKGCNGDDMKGLHSVTGTHSDVQENRIHEKTQSTAAAHTPVLQRFLGRPDDLSPRAWFKSTLFGYRRPFDRHDWYIRTGSDSINTNNSNNKN